MTDITNVTSLLETAAPAAEGGVMASIMSFLPIILLIPIFYFLMYRPQKKQEKETANMRNNLMIGDEIVTIGGIMGKIVKVKDDYVIIETGADRTKIKMRKTAIGSVEKKADSEEKKPATFKVSAGAKAENAEKAADSEKTE